MLICNRIYPIKIVFGKLEFYCNLEIFKLKNIKTQVFLNALSRVNGGKKRRQSVTKRSNGWNFIVEGVQFNSGVECYGNKAVNKTQRDCLGANKPCGFLAKARRERERRISVLPRSYQLRDKP